MEPGLADSGAQAGDKRECRPRRFGRIFAEWPATGRQRRRYSAGIATSW